MQLEGSLNIERKRVQRWVPIVAIVVPVFLFMAATTWFIRAFIAPPMAAIPAPMTTAAVARPELPAPQAPSRPSPQTEKPAVPAYTEPTDAAPALPMFATFALAPPSASLRNAPAATADPEPDISPPPEQTDKPTATPTADPHPSPATVASLPEEKPLSAASAALEPSVPVAGPIPLPPQRRQVSAIQVEAPVPLPRARPATEEAASATTESERRMFSAHGAE